jgi:O-antigen/teichoic acid export membrane protein
MLNLAWEPKLFAIKYFRARRRTLAGLRDGVFRLLAPSLLAIVLASPIVLRVFAPPSYRTNTLSGVVSVVACSAIPYAWYASNIRRMLTFRDTRSIYWVAPLSAVVNILLNIVLVPVIGIMGSAVATFLAYALLAILAGLQGRRHVILPRIPPNVWVPLALVVVATLLLPLTPLTGPILFVRVVLAAMSGIWLAGSLRALVRQPVTEVHHQESVPGVTSV